MRTPPYFDKVATLLETFARGGGKVPDDAPQLLAAAEFLRNPDRSNRCDCEAAMPEALAGLLGSALVPDWKTKLREVRSKETASGDELAESLALVLSLLKFCRTDHGQIPTTIDAREWAEEFVKAVKNNPEIATDEGTMIGWFANAIMAGFDEACRRQESVKGMAGDEIALPSPPSSASGFVSSDPVESND